MLIGYARVSTQEQTLDLQRDELTQAGCGKIFTDTLSGAKAGRPGLEEALAFGALAEFERDLIRERTKAGLSAARARGRVGGRPKALDPKNVEMLQRLYDDPQNSIDDICRTLGISRTTLYRYVKPGARTTTV